MQEEEIASNHFKIVLKKKKKRSVMGFSGGSDCKESACNAGDPGSIPMFRRSSGEGNGNPIQYSYLGNSMDRRAL